MAQLQISSTDTIKWTDGNGNGHDGNITISANTTDSSANTGGLSGTASTKTATVTSAAGFAIGDIVILHQTRHSTNHGEWQFNKITNIVGTTITFKYDLVISFDSTGSNDAQMYECKQYANVTVNSTYTWTGQEYDRSNGVGGIFWFFHTGVFTNNGAIDVDSKGFIGGEGGTSVHFGGNQGDSYKDNGLVGGGGEGADPNDGGGGRGDGTADADGAGGGAGAGHAADGTNGSAGSGGTPGTGGNGGLSHGEADLNKMYLGSGAGGGGYDSAVARNGGDGGRGAGIFGAVGLHQDISGGNIYSRGATGGNANSASGAGGGGAGGSVFLKASRLILGTDKIIFSAGSGGAGSTGGAGGAGSIGRCRIEYGNSYTGSVTSASIAQDRTLAGSAAAMFMVF